LSLPHLVLDGWSTVACFPVVHICGIKILLSISCSDKLKATELMSVAVVRTTRTVTLTKLSSLASAGKTVLSARADSCQ